MEVRLADGKELMVKIGGRPPVDIPLAVVEAIDTSLSVLGLRRARSSAVGRDVVGVIEEELLAALALYLYPC